MDITFFFLRLACRGAYYCPDHYVDYYYYIIIGMHFVHNSDSQAMMKLVYHLLNDNLCFY